MMHSIFLVIVLLTMSFSLSAAADTAAITADGKPVVTVTLPAGWSSVMSGEKTVLLPPGGAPHVQMWQLSAASVADAEKNAATAIVSQVTEFKLTSATALTIAGNPARQLVGTGLEADDGDPSNAEVTIFTVGGKVFLLIAHGEGDGTTKRHTEIMTIFSSVIAK